MLGEVVTGLGVFKSMFDLAKSMKDMNDAAMRNGVAIELQEQILSAQQAQFTLVEQVRTLETDIARFETWDAEKDRYELKNVDGRVFVYRLKEDCAGDEPPHWLCAKCYQARKKGFFQYKSRGPVGQDAHKSIWACNECGGQIMVHHASSPGASHAPQS